MSRAMECVQAARAMGRPTGQDYVRRLITGFIELHGDRCYGDDGAVIGGLGWLGDLPVTVIAQEKGKDTKERLARNFGSAHPEGYRKALRLMKAAEKFRRPVLCLVDTAGAFCGIGAEERGQGNAIAENLLEMMALQTPILTVFTGEGGSGGALALAVADEVWMLQDAVYSVISPEGCASILWKDPKRTAEAAEQLKLTAQDLHGLGIVERILPLNQGEAFYPQLQEDLLAKFRQLLSLSPQALADQRYTRFRKMGVDAICLPS